MADTQLNIVGKVAGGAEIQDLLNKLNIMKELLFNLNNPPKGSSAFNELSLTRQAYVGLNREIANLNKDTEANRGIIKAVAQAQREYSQQVRESERAQRQLNQEIKKQSAENLKFGGQVVELGSLDAISGRLETLIQQQNRLRTGTAAWTEMGAKIQVAKDELQRVTALTQKTTGVYGQFAMVGRNLNFVMQDSVYFFKNFQLGVIAVGNNIDMLANSIIYANATAKSMGSTLGRELLSMLKGPSGIILAIGLASAAFQAITFAMATTKSEAEKQKDIIAGLIEKYKSLAEATQKEINNIENLNLQDLIIAYRGLNDELTNYIELRNKITNKPIIDNQLSGEALKFAQAINKTTQTGNFTLGSEQDQKRFSLLTATTKELNNFSAALIALGQGQQSKLKDLIPQIQLERFQLFLSELSKKNIPSFVNELNISGLQFSLTSKAAGEFANKLKEINKEKSIKNDSALDSLLKQQQIQENLSKNLVVLGEKSITVYKTLLKEHQDILSSMDLKKYSLEDQLKITNEILSKNEEIKKINKSALKERQSIGGLGGTTLFGFSQKDLDNLKKGSDEFIKSREDAFKKVSEIRLRYDAMQEAKSDDMYIKNQRARLAAELKIYSEENGKKLNLEKEFQETRKYLESYYGDLIQQAQLRKFKAVSDAMTRTITSAFSKIWNDIFGEANSLLEQFLQNVLTALVEVAAQKAALSITESILGLLGIFTGGASMAAAALHTGGVVKAHSGMLAKDEIPIIAKRGEVIWNERQQQNLFDMVNNRTQQNQEVINNQPINITMPVILDGKKIAEHQYKFLPHQLYRMQREGVPIQ